MKNGPLGGNVMRSVLLSVSIIALATSAMAQPAAMPKSDNLEKLGGFRQTGTVEPPQVAQTGRRADALRRNLEKVKVPSGFKIDLYAVVPDARHMAVGP